MKKMNLTLSLGCALITFQAFAQAPNSAGTAAATQTEIREEVLPPIIPASATVSTLADALAAAYVNNGDLLATRKELMAGHEKIAQEKAGYLPTIKSQISISGNKSQQSGSVKDSSASYPSSQRTSTRSGEITLSQNLFAGGSTVASVLAMDQEIRSSWANLIVQEQKIFFKVIESYLDLISKISTVEVHKANHAAMKKSHETALEKHKIGEEALTQVANAEAKLAKAEAKLRSAEADVIGAKAALAAIVGVEPGNLKKPEAPADLPKKLDNAILIATENNPNIIKAQFEHTSAKAKIDKINGKYLPSVDLQAKTIRNESSNRAIYPESTNYPSTKQSDNKTNNSITLSMSYDIYAGGSYSSQKREAHDRAISKRIAIEGAKTSIIGNVKSAFESHEAARTNVDNFKRQVKAAGIALESTRQEVEIGTKVLLDYLNSQSEFVEAQLNLIEAEKIYFKSGYEMVQHLGGLHAKAMKLTVPYFDPESHYNNISVGF